MEDKESNGFDLELILQKAPTEEVRNGMIVDAVARGLTKNPDYIRQAIPVFEQQKRYAVLGSLYGLDKESPFYDAVESAKCYKMAYEILSFKKDARSKIGTGAVLKEMGGKSLRGIASSLKFIGGGFILPSTVRKSIDKSDDSFTLGALRTLVAGFSALFSSIPISYFFGENKFYKFLPIIGFGVTNMASGLYEWFRYEGNKMEKRAKGKLEASLEGNILPSVPIQIAPNLEIQGNIEYQRREDLEREDSKKLQNHERKKISQ